MIAINRAPDGFRYKIKCSRQSHGCEPEVEEATGEPSGNGGLGAGLDGIPDEKLAGRRVKPGEREEPGHQEPLGDLERSGLAVVESNNGPDGDQNKGQQEDVGRVAWEIEVRDRGVVTNKYACDSDKCADVPNDSCSQKALVASELHTAETRGEPETDTDRSGCGPAESQRVHGDHAGAAVGEERASIEEAGPYEFDGADQFKDRAKEQPEDG